MSRISKALALVLNTQHSVRSLFPRPWAISAVPYYIVGPLDNHDGHGGHTRKFLIDEQGVPYRNGSKGRTYLPLAVARYALQMWSIAGLNGDRDAKAKALKVLPWLMHAADASGTWETGNALPPGIPSAIVQGVAISALTRFALEVRDSELERLIERATARLVTPVENGGTLDVIPEGPFLEEFATRSHVLNGCVYGLFALHDVVDGCGHDGFRAVAHDVERSLIHALKRFTTASGWSRYALDVYGTAPLASVHYHRSHIRLFTIIAERTTHPTVRETVEGWQAAHNRPWTRTAIALAKSFQVVRDRDFRRLPLR